MKWNDQELKWLEDNREIINDEDLLVIKAELGKYRNSLQIKVLLAISKIKRYKLHTEINHKTSLARLYMEDENGKEWAICSTMFEPRYSWQRESIIRLWEKGRLGIDISEFITKDHDIREVR